MNHVHLARDGSTVCICCLWLWYSDPELWKSSRSRAWGMASLHVWLRLGDCLFIESGKSERFGQWSRIRIIRNFQNFIVSYWNWLLFFAFSFINRFFVHRIIYQSINQPHTINQDIYLSRKCVEARRWRTWEKETSLAYVCTHALMKSRQ